jgi:hypothetical protein
MFAAVKVGSASEFYAADLAFLDFNEFGAIDDKVNGNGETATKGMFELFDIKFSNVKYNSYSGIIESGFEYIYTDGLTLDDCYGKSVFCVGTDHGFQVPVFTRFSVKKVATVSGTIYGLPAQYFVVEHGIFENTESFYENMITRMYYENCVFIGTDGTKRTAMEPNGGLSLVNCNFTNLGTAVKAGGTNSDVFICRCKFAECEECLFIHRQWVEIAGCLFETYGIRALYADLGDA